ncbi:hypothetical protein BKA65DRAFT_482290 [Rhexocercosporidium sp. MPI-PUGE-AT-0058]|nr:hypothetical protein BKA65DRAFT_482290 [Rhexocercosporidium sp. MPI-PUGE-AT-0058]
MALRMGIGDVFTLCKGAVDLCSRAIHEDHEGMHTIITEMKQIRTHLKSLETQIGDEKTFINARPDIAPVIKRSLEPLHRDLSDLKDTLHFCSGPRKPSIHVVDQVRYLVLYKAKLDGFRDKLPIHRASICAMQELIDSQSPRERRESTVKLEGIVEEQERDRMRVDEYEKAQKEVVRMFEERMGSLPSEGGRSIDSGLMLKRLEDDLVEKGMERGEAEQTLFPITKALLRQPLPSIVERRPSAQKPDFKLNLFDLQEESDCGSGKMIDNPGLELRDDGQLAPDDNIDVLKDEEAGGNPMEDRLSQELNAKTTASPVSFLTQRRPLLETRMMSLDMILPRT